MAPDMTDVLFDEIMSRNDTIYNEIDYIMALCGE